jgi:hypothetical protein
MRDGALPLINSNQEIYFEYRKSHAYDAAYRTENYVDMPFRLEENRLDYFVPVNWLNSAGTVYPVTIDPLVSASDTLPQSSIIGSGYTATWGTDGCSYYLNNLMTPPNCEITGISTYFSYMTNLPCIRDDGGFDITLYSGGDSCISRNFTCPGGIQGDCFFWPAQLLNAVPPLSPCVSAPQCQPYPLNFRLRFRRQNWLPIVPCDATCVLANSDWIMTIEGRTVGLTSHTLPTQTLCEGECTNLTAQVDSGGVSPFVFTWQPGNLTGSVVNVCPVTTTHYTVTVSDQCGTTDTAGADIYVVPYQNPGFTIAPGDTVCDGTPMVFSTNGTAPPVNYY